MKTITETIGITGLLDIPYKLPCYRFVLLPLESHRCSRHHASITFGLRVNRFRSVFRPTIHRPFLDFTQ
jgi:hypothetical protein